MCTAELIADLRSSGHHKLAREVEDALANPNVRLQRRPLPKVSDDANEIAEAILEDLELAFSDSGSVGLIDNGSAGGRFLSELLEVAGNGKGKTRIDITGSVLSRRVGNPTKELFGFPFNHGGRNFDLDLFIETTTPDVLDFMQLAEDFLKVNPYRPIPLSGSLEGTAFKELGVDKISLKLDRSWGDAIRRAESRQIFGDPDGGFTSYILHSVGE